MRKLIAAMVLVATAFVAEQVMSESASANEIVVYSARKEHLIKPLFDAYEKKTGIKIRYITDSAAPLLARLRAEGSRTPADILMTVDAGNLWQAAENNVLAVLDSPVLEENVPAHLRDPSNRWFGLSVRARTIVYNTEALSADELGTYQDLADPKWEGRLCLRTSKKVYNQSLVAMMIGRMGEEKTEQIVKSWVSNLAVPPYGSDNDVMLAIAAGQCDVGIVNTYYFGRLQKDNPDTKLALFWPNQGSGDGDGASGSGVHINVSGAGVTRYASNPQEAQKLIEWLSSEEAQGMFAGLNLEYPVNSKVAADPQVVSWGDFKPERQNLSTAGELQVQAVMLMDRAGYR